MFGHGNVSNLVPCRFAFGKTVNATKQVPYFPTKKMFITFKISLRHLSIISKLKCLSFCHLKRIALCGGVYFLVFRNLHLQLQVCESTVGLVVNPIFVTINSVPFILIYARLGLVIYLFIGNFGNGKFFSSHRNHIVNDQYGTYRQHKSVVRSTFFWVLVHNLPHVVYSLFGRAI